jgi:lipopolysaccharide/colanic/teichoic acid biosynthesis glycosyltransferase
MVADTNKYSPAHELLDREEILQKGKRYWRIRRIQDVVLSVIALAVLWPLMLVTAIAVVLDRPGAGPIFAQTRVGRDGKTFTFYKFRSMCPNAEEKLDDLMDQNEMDGPVFKIKEDPRITRVGRFIRKTSIDELPQLWNVLKGEMSIVGPRPGIPREVEQYDDYARQRLLITPGLTCYWQIQPNRNRLSFEEWVELDIQYINERSFLTDWKIIFATFGAVLGMNGE